MNQYVAKRAGESPGIKFKAKSHTTAMKRATRELEPGCYPGQKITLVMWSVYDGFTGPTDFYWEKIPGQRWQACGDAE